MAFPSPPWSLQGQAWVSVLRAAAPGRPTGTWVAAFVDYQPGGVLSYSELLVAERVSGLGFTLRSVWVDSMASLEGGQSLWAIPKEAGELRHHSSGLGLVRHAEWAAASAGRTIASASFADAARVAPRLPFRATAVQPRRGGRPVQTPFSGTGRSLACLAHWDFPADGPLGWLTGKQPLASFRVRDFSMTFG